MSKKLDMIKFYNLITSTQFAFYLFCPTFVMMKKIFLFLFVSISVFANAQKITALDDQNGFREMHFGDSLSLFPTLKAFEYSKDSSFIFYRKTDENLIFSGAKVDIVYTFYRGQLSTVFIHSLDSLGSRKILKTLQNSYGTGYQQDKYMETYMWYGRLVNLSYYENVNTFLANVYISSIKMQLKSEGRDKY